LRWDRVACSSAWIFARQSVCVRPTSISSGGAGGTSAGVASAGATGEAGSEIGGGREAGWLLVCCLGSRISCGRAAGGGGGAVTWGGAVCFVTANTCCTTRGYHCVCTVGQRKTPPPIRLKRPSPAPTPRKTRRNQHMRLDCQGLASSCTLRRTMAAL